MSCQSKLRSPEGTTVRAASRPSLDGPTPSPRNNGARTRSWTVVGASSGGSCTSLFDLSGKQKRLACNSLAAETGHDGGEATWPKRFAGCCCCYCCWLARHLATGQRSDYRCGRILVDDTLLWQHQICDKSRTRGFDVCCSQASLADETTSQHVAIELHVLLCLGGGGFMMQCRDVMERPQQNQHCRRQPATPRGTIVQSSGLIMLNSSVTSFPAEESIASVPPGWSSKNEVTSRT